MLKATFTAVAFLAAAPAFADGADLYATNCSSCHGAEREGMGADFPELKGVKDRLKPEEIATKIEKGGEMMPPFDYLSPEEREQIVAFLTE